MNSLQIPLTVAVISFATLSITSVSTNITLTHSQHKMCCLHNTFKRSKFQNISSHLTFTCKTILQCFYNCHEYKAYNPNLYQAQEPILATVRVLLFDNCCIVNLQVSKCMARTFINTLSMQLIFRPLAIEKKMLFENLIQTCLHIVKLFHMIYANRSSCKTNIQSPVPFDVLMK